MFNNIDKNKKVILYFFILISFLFILPIIFWFGVLIGYRTCTKSMNYQIQEAQKTLDTKPEIDNNFLEINL